MNNQQQPKVGAGVGRAPSQAEIDAALQACHRQLYEQRCKIISLYDLFLRTSAAYYTMGDMSDESAPASGPELLLAMSEFKRRGFIKFSDAAVEQVSKDYVQSLKMLKQVVDNAATICDRLAMLTSAQQRQQPANQPQSATVPQPAFNSLDEALEAELNAEGE